MSYDSGRSDIYVSDNAVNEDRWIIIGICAAIIVVVGLITLCVRHLKASANRGMVIALPQPTAVAQPNPQAVYPAATMIGGVSQLTVAMYPSGASYTGVTYQPTVAVPPAVAVNSMPMPQPAISSTAQQTAPPTYENATSKDYHHLKPSNF